METNVPVTEERISHSTDQSIYLCFPANISEPDSTSESDETLPLVFSPYSIPSIFPANISEPDSTSVVSDESNETLPQVFSPYSIPSIFPPARTQTNSPVNNEIIPYVLINIESCFPPMCDSDSDSFVSSDINTIHHKVLRSISIQSLFPSHKSNGSEDESYESYPNGQISETTNLKEFRKVSAVSSLWGRAGTAGLVKAVQVLDTLGSRINNLNLISGFTPRVTTKGNQISILAFEVANTIVKGANLMQSLSKKKIRHLKEVVLPSEGVQNLISRDMNELLRIAAADKREELKVFSGEVVRFGNRCKDPQWHNLGRYFDKLGSELRPQRRLKVEAGTAMQKLMTLVQYTTELNDELDRFDQDYRRKHQKEDNSIAAQRGDSLAILRAELKSQMKHVKSLKKKSLWSQLLEEVMEKLVDIVHFLYLEIHEAFGSADYDKPVEGTQSNHKKLGSAGLALHFANIITQIDTIVSSSSSVPPNTRDALYQGLPPSIKSVLRSKLQSFQVKEELTVPQIKAEMEKTLQWLVPIANNTTKAHHGFGWVGEWANTGSEVYRKPAGLTDLLRIETLHHADKEKSEAYILELVVWLHHLVSQVRAGNGGIRSSVRSPIDLEDLLRASAEVLGKGTFGTTYKAALEDATTVVVKRLKEDSAGKREFEQQMEVVGSIKHEHVSPLRAYYYSKDEKLVVYDYYKKGSVSAMLHRKRGEQGRIPLNWETRLRIAIGAARGIAHIHMQSGGNKLVHGNIKASNIFLNSQDYGCVSDVGLATLMSATLPPVMRSAGYQAPELTDTRKASQASDVYSFGVLLLELLTGKSPVLATGGHDDVVHLVRWVNSVVREEWTAEVFDVELLRYTNIEEEMVDMLQLGLNCVDKMPENRPKMVDVLNRVENIRPVNTGNRPSAELVPEISTPTPVMAEIGSSSVAGSSSATL